MLDLLVEQKASLLEPIPGGDPYGEDPKYEDSFAWLKEEIAKMGGMGAGATDWEKVELESRTLLGERAKDLNLIAYLVTAWVILHKGEGLIAGLEVLAHFSSKEAWPEIFPKPMPKKRKARGLSLVWLQKQIGDRLNTCTLEDRDLLERGIEACNQIKDCIYDAFEDPPATFKGIRKTFEEWLAQIPEEEPEPEPVEEPPAEAEETAPEPAAAAPPKPKPRAKPKEAPTVEAPQVAEDADASALYEALGKIARQLQPIEPSNPIPYLLQRMAIWADASLPRHEESKETFFPAPPDDVVDSLKNMASKGAWEALLAKVEDLCADRWFWLDLQYYAATAAHGMQADEVAEIIESRTHKLIEALPELSELKFNDGTSFASPQTRDWLGGLGRTAGGGAAAPDPAEQLLSAMRQLGDEQFAEAMQLAQETIRGAGNERSTFRMRLQAARFCIEAGQFYWAESLAESLVIQIDHHHLIAWEPELAGAVWGILLEVARELRETGPHYEALEHRAMTALSGLDLARVGRYPKARPTYS